LPFSFPSLLGLQSRKYLQATEAILPPVGQQLDEATMYVELARACGVSLFGSKPLQKLLERLVDRSARRSPDGIGRLPQEKILSLVLRLARQGSFGKLVEHEHGRPLPVDEGGDFLGERVLTEDGLVDLAPQRLLDATARLDDLEQRELANARAGRFKLITRRQVKTHNSGWTHNAPSFVNDRFNTNHLYVAPDDLERIGVAEGDLVDVSTDVATVRVPVAVEKHLMPGVVALPHGWGHQHAKGLSHSSKAAGVNVNLLSADGPDRIEKESGMANLTGFAVEVVPAAGPLDPTSWSGITPETATPAGAGQPLGASAS
ncbi:MAG: molybdopterin dinucleotide binding domain-containing protein, partial [Nitriliruptorales bacterium]|nr:molybdopterin dinucleotide binding domain-containing protein [Nitriliruptorales bacterium]